MRSVLTASLESNSTCVIFPEFIYPATSSFLGVSGEKLQVAVYISNQV